MAKHILYTEGALMEYDDSTLLYKPNFTGNLEMLSLTGYGSNDTATLAEIAVALNDNINLFCSGSDLANPLLFNFKALVPAAIMSQNDLDKIILEVDRVPDLTYNDLRIVGQNGDVNGGFQYVATVDVWYEGRIATTFQYTMQFIEDDFKVYTFSDITYTNSITGKSATLAPLNITYQLEPQVGDPTLKADWPLNDVTGLEDQTGNGWDFEVEIGNAPTHTAGDGAAFDGSSCIVIPNSKGEFYPADSEWSDLVTAKYTGGGSAVIMGVVAADARTDYYVSTSSGWKKYCSSNREDIDSATINVFEKLVTVHREVTTGVFVFDLYGDGVLIDSPSGDVNPNTTYYMRIGAGINETISTPDVIPNTAKATWFLTGCAKNAKYYTRALTQADVTNYQNDLPIQPPA